MPVNQQQLRDAGFDGIESYRDDVALRLLCAFNGVDHEKAPPAWWAHPNPSTRAAWRRVAEEARRILLLAEPLPRVRHLKRGTEYDVISEEAELQTDRDLVDGDLMTVYRGDAGRLWVRHVEEFSDGRFVPIEDVVSP